MHIIHQKIGIPKVSQAPAADQNETRFTISPLPRGFGVTLGNSMRRVMLSSIPGARVTGVKVKGATHEYATLTGVKDSVLDMMLNLKGLVVEKATPGIEWLSLSRNKAGEVTAKDIKCPSGVKVLNPELYVTEIDKDGVKLDIEIRVEKSVGYLSLDELKKKEDDVNVLLVDANFSPVSNVQYEVTNVRVGDMTDLDSLVMTVKTNGSIEPRAALQFAGDMLKSYFGFFNEESVQVEGEFISDIKTLLEQEKREAKQELEKEAYTPIEIMGLSPRTLNALVNGQILSIEQLTKCTEAKLSSIKGFGKKAMNEVRASLGERGLKLLGDD